jgi:hypothetical protein
MLPFTPSNSYAQFWLLIKYRQHMRVATTSMSLTTPAMMFS